MISFRFGYSGPSSEGYRGLEHRSARRFHIVELAHSGFMRLAAIGPGVESIFFLISSRIAGRRLVDEHSRRSPVPAALSVVRPGQCGSVLGLSRQILVDLLVRHGAPDRAIHQNEPGDFILVIGRDIAG